MRGGNVMNERKVFCVECRKDVEFRVTDTQLVGTIKGEKYSCLGRIAHCTNCGSEIYVADINDYNLEALYDKYRQKHGIVSLDIIKEIPNKYAIGKRPLSLLLGWGEHTFSRYCEGDVPTKQYSDILQKLYDEPTYYRYVLEENKRSLRAEGTYKKSLKAVNELLDGGTSKKTKIDVTIEYLLDKCGDITALALQKALYYIQGFYYAFNSKYLFEDDCEAWAHGPVYRDVYFRYCNYKYNPIKANIVINENDFSYEEKAIFDSVVKHICCYSGKVLEKFTHSEEPWISARGNLAELKPSNTIIDKRNIGKYFETVKEQYNMVDPDDIKKYSKNMFQRI